VLAFSTTTLSACHWSRSPITLRLSSGYLTRAVLGYLAGCAPEMLEFDSGQYGRPYVSAPSSAVGLSFSLSHTAGLVGTAVDSGAQCAAGEGRVGLDVEYVDRAIEPEEIAADVLTPGELISMRNLKPWDRRRYFFRLWTMKEAYLKALGLGLAVDPRSVSFVRGNGDCGLQVQSDYAEEWSFRTAALYEAHWFTVCYRRSTLGVSDYDGQFVLRSALSRLSQKRHPTSRRPL
jgi:4'-phosphopantetheinyl transferase